MRKGINRKKLIIEQEGRNVKNQLYAYYLKSITFQFLQMQSLQSDIRYERNILYYFLLLSYHQRNFIYSLRGKFTYPLLLIRIFREYIFIYIIFQAQMGLCPLFASKAPEPPKAPPPQPIDNDLKSSQRHINNIPKSTPEQQKPDHNQKKVGEEDSLNSSNGAHNNNFYKNNSSTQFSSLSHRKTSSLLSRGIFDSDSIILKRDENSPRLKFNKEQRYILIDSVYQVKKGPNNYKIVSPYNQCELKCNPNKILPTYYLTEGIPRQSLSQIPTKQYNVIRPLFKTTESPIHTKITLVCKKCSTQTPRKVKFTFSTSVIKPKQIICDQCQAVGQWSLINLQSNYPVWAGDKKISKKKSQKFSSIDNLPELMRVMGCVDCFCYPMNKNYNQLICGCVVCLPCHVTREAQKRSNECQFCES